MVAELHRRWARALVPGLELPQATEDGDAMSDWAQSGVVHLTGRPDGPPLFPPGAAASAARGAEVAFRALAERLGRPQRPLGWHRLLAERAALSGIHHRNAPWSVGGATRAVATTDGWVSVTLARPDDLASVGALVEGPVLEPWTALESWAVRHTQAEVHARCRLLGIPCGPIPTDGEWAARGPDAVRVDEVASGSPGTGAPLVVDFSALWAGPLCAQLLGTAGARVVKVELPTRLDGARRGLARLYEVLHAGHEAVLLDPAADAGLLDALVRRADIVVEASRPRSLTQLGLDAREVCRVSPTTWVSITAWGRDHPDHVGFGDDVAMSAGLVVREAGTPYPVGDALADPLTGMHAAVAALASYLRGGSRLLDVAMRDVVAAASAWHCPERDELPVEPPRVVRRPTGHAPEPGADTAAWRARLAEPHERGYTSYKS